MGTLPRIKCVLMCACARSDIFNLTNRLRAKRKVENYSFRGSQRSGPHRQQSLTIIAKLWSVALCKCLH